MRCPFVSRVAYEMVEAAWLHEMDRARDAEKSRDALLEKYHALRLAGHVDTPVYPAYIDQPKTVDEVDEERALEEQA